MSLEAGTYKRVVTFTVTVLDAGSPAPSATAVKIATDTATNKDIWLDQPVWSWKPV